jgi:glycosyltransferase involved in cell wall biosynthesis
MMSTRLFVLPFLHFGVGRLALDLMLAVRRSGHPVGVVTCGWRGELGDDPLLVAEARAAGIRFGHADVFSRDAADMARAAASIDRLCDAWNVSFAHAFTAIAAAAVCHRPVVASAVGWSPRKEDWQRAMDAAVLQNVAGLTAVSAAVAAELRAAGVTRGITVIENGVAVPAGCPRPPARIATIGAVAHLIPRKGIDLLLDAVAQLPANAVSRLRVAGDGEARDDLQGQAVALGIDDRVEWCGHVPVRSFLETVDALVVPSRSDALPLVLLDAMATGTPVAAARTGGIPEALTDDDGWLFEAGDSEALAAALRDMIRRPKDAACRAIRAHRRARAQFSLEHAAERYLRVYDEATPRSLTTRPAA